MSERGDMIPKGVRGISMRSSSPVVQVVSAVNSILNPLELTSSKTALFTPNGHHLCRRSSTRAWDGTRSSRAICCDFELILSDFIKPLSASGQLLSGFGSRVPKLYNKSPGCSNLTPRLWMWLTVEDVFWHL